MSIAERQLLEQGTPLIRHQVIVGEVIRAAISELPEVRFHVARGQSLRIGTGLECPAQLLWLLPVLLWHFNIREKGQIELQEIATVVFGRLSVTEVRVGAEDELVSGGIIRIYSCLRAASTHRIVLVDARITADRTRRTQLERTIVLREDTVRVRYLAGETINARDLAVTQIGIAEGFARSRWTDTHGPAAARDRSLEYAEAAHFLQCGTCVHFIDLSSANVETISAVCGVTGETIVTVAPVVVTNFAALRISAAVNQCSSQAVFSSSRRWNISNYYNVFFKSLLGFTHSNTTNIRPGADKCSAGQRT